ncbi:hypothetical protein MPTK1_2g23180 [Marchantia polymorpha subsp. ruderalis]|nr:hypothetical protein MARPO_0072s0013 [Marchantia polymorpha]BBN03402.1 hypothetical protein Mp_2g23180 [Marchantia polymorpha subsp. ruderalis]|eukprot:PTQ35249.1 hypothetical protein MARPO_0072s0013 [Marchantia polymorpha]
MMIASSIATVLLLSVSLFALPIIIVADSDQDQTAPARSKTYVLVHGPGSGSWNWYKIKYMLQQAGFTVYTPDLTSHGIMDNRTADTVFTLVDYAQPLLNCVASAPEKVILVAHNTAGTPCTLAMETYPEKIEKAVFLSAVMPISGTVINDYLKAPFQQLVDENAMHQIFAQGTFYETTSIQMNATAMREYYFGQSSLEDYIMASSLLCATPYRCFDDPVYLTPERYGSIDRFYIKTGQDKIVPPVFQDIIINKNPPKQVFVLKNSDHASFFSETDLLFTLLKNIPLL